MTTSLRCRDDDPDARGERRASIKKSDRPRGPTAEVDARLIRLGRVFAIPIAARQPQLSARASAIKSGIAPCSDELSSEPILATRVRSVARLLEARRAPQRRRLAEDTIKFVVSGMAVCQNSRSPGHNGKGC